MKKMFLLFAVLLSVTVQNLRAQDADVVLFNVILEDLFDITVINGNIQTATFSTALHYNGGVWEGGFGIVNGTSDVTMETTGNWNCTIDALDFGPANPQLIPIDNLGVWIDALGAHTIATGEVTYSCTAPASTQGLTNAAAPLISKGAGENAGDASDNLFRLHWRMGTRDNASMHATSMFDQMAAGDFDPGTYNTVVNLTLTPTP
jgi:hypothetical protein